MQPLVIEAVDLELAEDFRAALSDFETKLVQTESGGYQVRVVLAGSDRAIVKALRALGDYVTERAKGSAKLRLDGRAYTMSPQPARHASPTKT